MISYSKKIEMKILYKDLDDADNKRVKAKELKLKASTFTVSEFDSTMEIELEGKTIVVSATWPKEACEKAIALHKI